MAQAVNWDADRMLDVYIYDYLCKRKLQATAKAYQEEANVPSDPVAIDAPGGFLLEWWSVFWDIFIARTNEKHSEAAASYIETQMIKTRDMQMQMQMQQKHPHQEPEAQQQTHQLQMQQLLLQRHAQQQQQQQQRDRSAITALNPVGFLDTLRRQPSGAASILTSRINESALRDPLRRDGMDRSRLNQNKGRLLDPRHISSINLDATGVRALGQSLRRITRGNLQRVQNHNPPLPLLRQAMKNRSSPITDSRSAVDSQDGSLLGAHGSNEGGVNNLTLNGWPLTGLDQLRSGLPQLQKSAPLYQLYLQQQLLHQTQKNISVPPVDDLENRKMRMLLNCRSGLGKDGRLSLVGDAIENVGSQIQDSNADLLNKASKMQLGRKRKMSTDPSNSSGTLNTSGPTASPVPSTPTYTATEAISMPSSSTYNGSKASAIVTLDNTETLPSAPSQLNDIDRSVIDGPLEDNVESLLPLDVRDSAGTKADVNEGFTFVEYQAIPVSTKLECCAFSSDGKLLATGGDDRKVVLWCTESFTMKSMLDEHTLGIADIRFSPTKLRLATCSADQTIRVWDADNPSYSLRTFTGHSAAVTSLDFHPRKDDLIYSADANGEIRCWSITNGSCKKVAKVDATYIRFQPRHGRFYAGASKDTVSIVDAETQAVRLKLRGHKTQVIGLCWDVSGEYLATVSEDMARVWSFAPRGNGECIHELNSTRTDFRSCSFHPNYSFLLVIGCDRMLELWNMLENKMMTIPAHEGGISALATSDISGLVASASSDGFIKLWK